MIGIGRLRIGACVLAGAAAFGALAGCSADSANGDMSTAKSLLSPPGQSAAAQVAGVPAAAPVATTAAAQPTTLTDPTATAAPGSGLLGAATTPTEPRISSFKKRTAVLFSSARGSDGERVEAANFTFPLVARPGETGTDRIEIMTVKGPRWISRAEVNLESATASSQTTTAARPN